MNNLIYRTIGYLVLAGALLGLVSGCGGSTPSSYSENRQLYDQYMDMPGYYDFPKPVVFLPTEEYFNAPEEIDDPPVSEGTDN